MKKNKKISEKYIIYKYLKNLHFNKVEAFNFKNDAGYLNDGGGSFDARDTSDIRLKENIIDTTIKGIETVNNIKVRDFFVS